MTQVTRVKTGTKYEDIACYSRLVCVGDQIFVSNTAGRDPETKEMPEGVTEQARTAISNLERALMAVEACLGDVVAIRVYVPNPEDADAVGRVLGERFRGIDPALTLTCPTLGSTIYKVELDATAIRGASKAEAVYITL